MAKMHLPLMVLGLGLGLPSSAVLAQTYLAPASQPAGQGSVMGGEPQLRGVSAEAEATAATGGTNNLATTAPAYPIRPTRPIAPLQSNPRTAQELGPYDPTGISVGSFDLYPSLTIWGTRDDNVDNGQSGQASTSGRIEGAARLRSNWQRHQLEVDARASATGYNTPKREPDHNYGLNGELRLDLGEVSTLTLRSGLDIEREAANSVELRASGGTRSIRTVLNGSAQLDHRAGLFELQLRGGLVDESFDGDKARDFKLFTIGGRVGYRYTDQVVPFIDAEMSRRRFDSGPNAQDGDRLRSSIGVAVSGRDKWTGEFSVGQIIWKPDAAGQKSDRGFYADANLIWSPNALWQVTAGLETSLSSTSTAASSVLTHQVDLGANYDIRSNVTLGADLSVARESYKGLARKDWVTSGGLNAEYRLSRNTQLIGRYQHDRRNSTLTGENTKSNLFELGLRFQK
jgi:hypothetical protein